MNLFATSKNDRPLGYDAIIEKFSDLEKFPQNIILFAPEGTGKRKLAEFFIKKFFAKTISKYSEISLHPDLLIIDSADSTSKKKEITIDMARKVKDFLSLTSSQELKQIVLIDSIDKLNLNAANSLLKILEEPPQNSHFILLMHNRANILDTITSRSQIINLPSLSKKDCQDILQEHIEEEAIITRLTNIFPKSPGIALRFYQEQGLEIADEVVLFVEEKSLLLQDFIKKI